MLATAAAQLFKKSATQNPNPVLGVIVGLAAAASMFAGFLAIKSKMKAAEDAVPKFRKGDVFDILKGKAIHERGGVSIVDNSGERLAELEGDEKLFIVNKGCSRKHEDLLRDINNDDFSRLNAGNGSLRQLLDQIKGVHMIENAPDRVLPKQGQYQASMSVSPVALNSLQLEALKDLLKELSSFKKQEGSKPIVIDKGDVIEVREGNHIKRIHKYRQRD